MSHRDRRHAQAAGARHRWLNRLQTALLVLTDGLLRSLTLRELTGVLGHEIAHIANEDLRVMGLADSISRLTHLLALLGQIMLLFSLPALLWGTVAIQWPALLLLAVSPQLALLAQLGLSRVREFDAGPIHPALARHHWLHRRTYAAVAVLTCHRSLVQSARSGRAHGDTAW